MLPITGERVYLVAATNTGPDADEIIPSRLLTFGLSGNCSLQYENFKCREDGMIGLGMPCDDTCSDTCAFILWGDSPSGAFLLDLLTCQDNSAGGATLFACDSNQLSLTVYDNCEDLNCQIVTEYVPEYGFCIPMDTATESCQEADPVTNPKYSPCGASSIESEASSSSLVKTVSKRISEERNYHVHL